MTYPAALPAWRETMKHHPSELGLTGATEAQPVVRVLAAKDTAEAARWDAFVAECRAATFFHRSGWREIIEGVFRHRAYFLYAQRGARIEGVLPLARVKSWLFGDALVSLPFAVYGGVAAETGAAAAVLETEAIGLAERLGVFEEDKARLLDSVSGVGSAPSIRTIIQKAEVGGAKDNFIPTSVLSYSLSKSFEGLIGMDFMSNYSIKIDAKKKWWF